MDIHVGKRPAYDHLSLESNSILNKVFFYMVLMYTAFPETQLLCKSKEGSASFYLELFQELFTIAENQVPNDMATSGI